MPLRLNQSPQTAPDKAALARRAVLGTIAMSLVNSGRMGLQLLVLPVLARILGPSSFGIVSLAMPFILFANMLSDAGMGNALVRLHSPAREVESTVFWLSVMVGVCMALGLCGLGGPIEVMLHQPGLGPILMAMSPILILSSTLSVPNSRICRERRFGLFALGDLISAVLSSAAAILAALHGWGAWSLVLQQLVLWIAKAAWIFPQSHFRPAPVCRPSLARDLLSFGLNNVGANIADFLGKSAPALVIGSGLGVVAVGHYSMAYQLIRIPDLVLSGPLYLATFAALTALTASSAGGAAALSMRTIRLAVLILAPLFCGLALVADLLIEVLLGAKWAGTASVLAILSGAGFLICLYSLFSAVLMGLGRSDLQFRLCALCGGGMFAGAVLGRRWGLDGAAIGVTLGMLIAFPFYIAMLARQLHIGGRAALGSVARPLIATAVMAAAVLLVRHQLAASPLWLQLIACVATGVVAFAVTLLATSGRQVLDDVRTLMPHREPVGLG
jgi:PST family polysaccharide transporter